MASPFAATRKGSSSPFSSGSSSHPNSGHGNFFTHFVGNLAGDVKAAVVGIPVGLIQTVEHPIRTAQAMGRSEWQMYSPLFHGHFKQFGHNLYDHPLTPLLDVATVFSLGAGTAARLGKLAATEEEIAKGSTLAGRAARLREPKTVALTDPTGDGRHALDRHLSQRAGRRLVQEGVSKLEPHLPNWMGGALERGRYEKAFFGDMAHRHAAKSLMMTTAILAGKALTEADTAPRARSEIAAGLYLNLHRHAPVEVTPAEAASMMKKNRHYVGITDASQLDKASTRLLRKSRVRETHWERIREANAEQAHRLPQIERELEAVTKRMAHLADMRRRAGMAGDLSSAAEARSREAGQVSRKLTLAERRAARKADIAENGMILDKPPAEIAKRVGAAHTAASGFSALKDAERRVRREGTDIAGAQGVHQLLFSAEEHLQVPYADTEFTQLHRAAKALKREQARTYKARQLHNKATGELAALKKTRLDLEQRSFTDYFQRAGASEESFQHFVGNLGKIATTRDLERMAHTRDGKVRLVPKHDPVMLGIEAKHSAGFVKWLYQKPTHIWKMLQVGYTPRTITNNAVGNWALQAIRDPASLPAVWQAARVAHGAEQATEGMLHASPFRRNHWMYKHFGDELGNVFGHDMLEANGRVKQALKGGFYGIVHKLADEPVRMTAITGYLKRDPEVQALVKRYLKANPKLGRGAAFDMAVTRALKKDRGLRDRAAHHAQVIAGDYFTLRPWERKLRDLVPFYLWDRHIVRTTGNLVLDQPGRVAVMQQLSNQGINTTEKYLGSLPEFLRGAIPLSMLGLGKRGSRADVMLTASLNPFGTIGELAAAGEGVLTGGGPRPGDAILSQANPLLTSGIEFATGTSLLTGAPTKKHGGLITSVLANTGESLPQIKLLEAAMRPDTNLTPSGKQKLYSADDRSPASSLFGIPLRSVSKSSAQAMADKEHGRKKHKRRGKSSPFSG